MFWKVVRVEWRNLLAEKAVGWLLGLLAVMAAYAAWSGATSVDVSRAAAQAAVAAEAAQLAELKAQLAAVEAGGPALPYSRDPGDPAVAGRGLAGRLVALPPTPLASIAAGQRDMLAGTVRLTTQSRLTATPQGEAAMTGPTRQMTGAFDLAFVFVVLLPLLIIALTYDLVAGERERGTLALVLSQPVSLATFVMGKAFQRALVVVGVTLVLAAAALAGAGDGLLGGDGLARAALYLGALVAYALFWFAAAVAVNARGRSSAGNALALVGLWLALVVAVPGLVRVVVEAAYPPPSRVELVNLTREATSEIEEELTALEGTHGEGAPAGDRLLSVQEELDQRIGPVVVRFREQLAAQQSLVDGLRFLSPALVLHEALVDVAGTGALRQARFDAQVDAFHHEWRAFFFDRVRAGQRLTSADYDALPAFAFVEEPVSSLALRVGGGVLGLVLPALVLLAWAATGLRRVGRLA